MSTLQVVGLVIVGRISPAWVWMLNVSASVQPLRLRYRIASRAPLPDSSASLPSGLKIRRRATKPGSSGCLSTRTPSAPGPKCGSQSFRTWFGVSSTSSKMR